LQSATISWVALPSEVSAYVGYQNVADSSASLNSGTGTREASSTVYFTPGALLSPLVAAAPTTFGFPASTPTSFLVTPNYNVFTSDVFNVSADVFGSSTAFWVGASWIAVDSLALQTQGFQFDTGVTGLLPTGNLSTGAGLRVDTEYIFFNTLFGGSPKVVAWLNGIDSDISGDLDVSVTVSNITTYGFLASISSSSSVLIQQISIGWVAVLETTPGVDCPSTGLLC